MKLYTWTLLGSAKMPIHFGVNFGVTEWKKVKIPLMGISCPAFWCYIWLSVTMGDMTTMHDHYVNFDEASASNCVDYWLTHGETGFSPSLETVSTVALKLQNCTSSLEMSWNLILCSWKALENLWSLGCKWPVQKCALYLLRINKHIQFCLYLYQKCTVISHIYKKMK